MAPVATLPVPFEFVYQVYGGVLLLTVNVVELPAQRVFVPVTVGAGAIGFTVIVIEAQLGLNIPFTKFLAKYVVVEAGETVKVFPVPTWVPPQDPVYQ